MTYICLVHDQHNLKSMISEMPLKTNRFLQGLLLLLIIFVEVRVEAQENDTIITVDRNPEKFLKKIDIHDFTHNGLNFWQDEFSGHWAGIDFGFNMFVNEDYSGYETEFMDNDIFRSNTAYINFIQQSIGLQKDMNTFGLVTGLGLHLQSYRLDDNTTILKDENGIIHPDYLYYDDNQKSKLSVVSLVLPLLVEFQMPVNHFDNRIYFSAGMIGSYRLNSHSKIKYKAEHKEKLKVEDDFSIHNFKYSIMVRAGYRWFNVFATYDLVPLFEKDKGPELYPLTFGITFMRF